MSEEIFDFEKLEVYKKSLNFVDLIYEVTKKFPVEERYSLIDQFRRAAVSVCLNIAEGSGGSKGEFVQFIKISRRSIRECIAITEISRRRNYMDVIIEKEIRKSCIELSKMSMGLMKAIK
jgi:four helix bundle protein